MPYFVYRISEGATELVKNLEKLDDFENFKDAKQFARDTRSKQAAGDSSQIKVIFADNALHAEEMLMEKRNEPILKEWEK